MCKECEWEDLSDRIEEMLSEGDFDWADDTLSGILEWITDKKHCTDNQVAAVDNIARRSGS